MEEIPEECCSGNHRWKQIDDLLEKTMNDDEYECVKCKRIVRARDEGVHRTSVRRDPGSHETSVWGYFEPGDLVCKECSKKA